MRKFVIIKYFFVLMFFLNILCFLFADNISPSYGINFSVSVGDVESSGLIVINEEDVKYNFTISTYGYINKGSIGLYWANQEDTTKNTPFIYDIKRYTDTNNPNSIYIKYDPRQLEGLKKKDYGGFYFAVKDKNEEEKTYSITSTTLNNEIKGDMYLSFYIKFITSIDNNDLKKIKITFNDDKSKYEVKLWEYCNGISSFVNDKYTQINIPIQKIIPEFNFSSVKNLFGFNIEGNKPIELYITNIRWISTETVGKSQFNIEAPSEIVWDINERNDLKWACSTNFVRMNFIDTIPLSDANKNKKILIYTNDPSHKAGMLPTSEGVKSIIPLAWRVMPFEISTDTSTEEFALYIIDSAKYNDKDITKQPDANREGDLLLYDSKGRSMWNRLRDKTTVENDKSEKADFLKSEMLLYSYVTNSNYLSAYKFSGGYHGEDGKWVYGYTDYLKRFNNWDIQATSFDDNYYLYFAADFSKATANTEYEAIVYMEYKVD